MKKLTFIILILLLCSSVLFFFFYNKNSTDNIPITGSIPTPATSTIKYINSSADMIVVDYPTPNTIVGKDFTITGKARGTWFFEASFPIHVLDKDGKIITIGIAQAQSDWMTTDFVPFSVDIKIPDSYAGPITLVLNKDNPSGLEEHDASISFSITKKVATVNETTIKLYYYNPALDQGVGGTQCTEKGLVEIERTIPKTITPIQDAIKLLLLGQINEKEKAEGITSEFPLEDFTLKAASLNNGNLTLTFNDPKNKTVGGSCRISILWNQIKATAKQFPEVKTVSFQPEELFQP